MTEQGQPKYNTGISLLQAVLLIASGIASAYVPAVVSFVWLLVLLYTIYGFAVDDMRWLWYGVVASPALEVWGRMARAPFLPHEFGKYYLVLVLILLLLQHSKRTSYRPVYYVGILLLLALLPSIVVGLSTFNFESWVLNVAGIIELSVLLIFAARERWELTKFCRVMQFGLMPLIPVLIYLTIKTPDFDKINFALSSNFKTSGGFGSNQVSTVLGLGMVFTMVLIILKRPLFKIRWINYVLLILLLFRGFLTFSRGGMLAAGIALVIVLLPAALSSIQSFFRFTFLLIIFAGLSVFIFFKVNELTNNQLMLRYKGETIGTITGSKTRTLNTVTSGRLEIATTDWKMFKDNPVFGVGPGMSKDIRPQYGFKAIASHTEYTRLLSEHGIGGVLAILLLVLFPVWWVSKQKLLTWKTTTAALFVFALLTSTHSAMRTNTTIVCFILAAIPVFFLKAQQNKQKTKTEIA